MSIIHDALKKAQNKLEGKQNTDASEKMQSAERIETASSAVPSRQTMSQPQSASSSPIPLILGLSLLALACLLFFLFPYLKKSKPQTPPQQISVQPQATLPKTIPTTAVAAPPVTAPAQGTVSPAGALTLNGIMMTGKKQVALINNKIYEVGDMVNDKKIIDITMDKVELLDGGNTIILNVRSK